MAGLADDRVDHDLVAVLVEAGGVAAEDHRQGLLAEPDAAQRPQVVVVERGGLDGDGRPAGPYLGLGALPQLESVQRLVTVDACGIGGEHDPNLDPAAPVGEPRGGVTRAAWLPVWCPYGHRGPDRAAAVRPPGASAPGHALGAGRRGDGGGGGAGVPANDAMADALRRAGLLGGGPKGRR